MGSFPVLRYSLCQRCCSRGLQAKTDSPPPLRKHQPGQESEGQTGSWCLDKAVQPRDGRYQRKHVESSPRVERPMIVAGACSPVDQTYVTAKPGVTTLVMAEHHTKTKSSGAQYQAKCCYEQEDSSQALNSPSFPLQSAHNPALPTF